MQYKRLIQNLRQINPAMKIFVANMGNPDYFLRQLWGYALVQKRLAEQFANCEFINVSRSLQEFQQQDISGRAFVELSA
jgi:hypothetical protein